MLEGVPERAEGGEEARVEERQHLVEPVEPGRALGEGQALVDPPRAEMVEDRHALADQLARGGHQRRRLADRVDPSVGLALHHRRHLDAAEPVGFAEPFQRDDGAEGASGGDAVQEGLDHGCLRDR